MPISNLVSPILSSTSTAASTGRWAAFKQGWGAMPTWKKWLVGGGLVVAGVSAVAAILTATVFTGGAAAAALTGVAAGCNIAAGASAAISNGHSFVQAIKAKRYAAAGFSLLGCMAGLLGGLGSIFHFANAVNLVAQADMAVAAGTASLTSTAGGVAVAALSSVSEEERNAPTLISSSLNEPLFADSDDLSVDPDLITHLPSARLSVSSSSRILSGLGANPSNLDVIRQSFANEREHESLNESAPLTRSASLPIMPVVSAEDLNHDGMRYGSV